jgi:hypothetical protein
MGARTQVGIKIVLKRKGMDLTNIKNPSIT